MSILVFLLLTFASASDQITVKTVAPGVERHERNVDEAARASQESAIRKLTTLLKKYRGTSQEPVFLARLADMQSQEAAIRFRISHGATEHARASAVLAWKIAIKRSIATASELIAKFPKFTGLAQTLALRGRSYEELEDKAAAAKDFVRLTQEFPETEEVLPAYMSLANFATEANDHARAITWLRHVEHDPDSPFYPFALYKLSWAHFNLRQIPQALSFAERHVSYYARPTLSSSDLAFRDNMLLDSTVFYLEGFELNGADPNGRHGVDEALTFFRKLEKGPALGRMLQRYAKLLRSHGHEQALVEWKNRILAEESARPESLEVVLTVFENQLNRRRYAQLEASARDMNTLYARNPKFEGFPRARKQLLDAAETLQGTILRNEGAQGLNELCATLAAIYDSFTRVVEESDPRIPLVHYNLAETLFRIKDWDGATRNYRWIVERGKWDRASTRPGSVVDGSLKAIGARYEQLRSKGLIPAELKPQPVTAANPKISLDLVEWISWIDVHTEKAGAPADNFVFEAARALYAQGQIAGAVERMISFARLHPKSKFAMPSASLALDSRVAGQEWTVTHQLAHELLKIEAWNGSEFSKRVFAVAADAWYKLLEADYKANDFRGALKRAEVFSVKYATSTRLADMLGLAGAAALQTGERDKAMQYFTRLLAEKPNAANAGEALQARAAMHEDQYQFGAAASDLRRLLQSPSGGTHKDALKLRRKALALAWLEGSDEHARALASPTICVAELADDCDRHRALLALESGRGTPETKELVEHARKGTEVNRAVWATLALQQAEALSFRDRLRMIHQLAAHWGELDALTRFALTPRVSVSIARAFELNRGEIRQVSPLLAKERYIIHRVETIREVENAATQAMKLPFVRIRAVALDALASFYLDMTRELRSLPVPKSLPEAELAGYEDMVKKLAMPFEEKGQDLRARAFEIASKGAIEAETFAAIATPFLLDNPSQAQKLRATSLALPAPAALDLKMLALLDPRGRWESPDTSVKDPSRRARSMFSESLLSKRWARAAFFLQELQEKALIHAGAMGAVRAIAFAQAGAQGEALAELAEARADLAEDEQVEAALTLATHYNSSMTVARAKDLVEEVKLKRPARVAAR